MRLKKICKNKKINKKLKLKKNQNNSNKKLIFSKKKFIQRINQKLYIKIQLNK